MAVYTTKEAKGQKQDLHDIVMSLNTHDTPFLTLIGEGSAKAKTVEWVEENLEAADGSQALLEGADMTAAAATPGTERSNYTQIFGEAVQVSGTLEAVDTAGNLGHMATEIRKKARKVKANIEKAMVGAKQAKALQSGSTGRKMDSALNQISDKTTNTANAARAFSEDQVTDVLTKLYEEGGNTVNTIMLAPKKKVELSKFGDAANRTRDLGAEKKLVNAIDLYVSDFGELTVVPNRHFKADSVMIFDPEMWEASYLRRMQVKDLAKTGDSEKKMVVAEVTLKHAHQKASGLIEKLS